MTEKEKQRIGHLIRSLRQEVGKNGSKMTLEELAKLSGVNKDTINRLELGRHQMLPDTAVKLAPILKTTAAKLMGL